MRALVLVAAVLTLAVCTLPAKSTPLRTIGHGQIRFQGLGPERWARKYRVEHRRFQAEQRHRLRDRHPTRRLLLLKRQGHAATVVGSSFYAIRLAAAVFGIPETQMRAVASCETGGSFSPTSYNTSSGASGLLQFLPSTWANQGLPGFSVFDPLANALAAARIVAREGWGQWSCRP